MDIKSDHLNDKKVIVVTGASGFVGRNLIEYLCTLGFPLLAVVRNNSLASINKGVEQAQIKTDFSETDWTNTLSNCETIVHLAARVHVMKETHANPAEAYYQVNVLGTMKLARQAAALGVKRFIYLSTIKVNGEMTQPGQRYCSEDSVFPEDFYAISKYQAEKELFELAHTTGMQVIVIRPPLIYGPGVKGNFQRMIHWLRKGYPLPLKSLVMNQRSFLSIHNLVDLLHHCIEYPKTENQLFLASDGEDLSTAVLFEKLAHAMNKKACLFSFPPWLFSILATVLGKKTMVQRLMGSLQIDISKTRQELSWEPKFTVEAALQRDFQLKKDINRSKSTSQSAS